MLEVELKENIKASFSAHALTYDLAASIHRRAASALFNRLRTDEQRSPSGAILEIGCGTGNLSSLLDEHYRDRELIFVDLSESMLRQCRLRLEAGGYGGPRRFIAADAEQLHLDPSFQHLKFAEIASSFTFQWFTDLQQVVGRLISLLAPGGKLYFSFPATGSFPEWRQISLQTNVPFTANPLPGVADLNEIARQNNCRLDFEQLFLVDHFGDSHSFFSSLKRLGAATRFGRETHSVSSLRRLMRHWDEQCPDGITATYHVLSGVLFK
jgi:malonyl-CoA O-methyltransferase